MSWYLFNNSPQRQLRGKKVDGFQNIPRNKVILDWGLGELSPPKKNINTVPIEETYANYNNFQKQQQKNQSKTQNEKSKYRPEAQKARIIEQAVKVLTQSSDEQNKQELLKVFNNYQKKKDKSQSEHKNQTIDSYPKNLISYQNNQKINKSLNVLNPIQFDANKLDRNKSKQPVDIQAAKRMRFLQNSLLPGNKRDNMTAVLDYELNSKVATSSLGDSRLSGKSKFGNKVIFYLKKKNDSDVQLGDGFNAFVPMRQKVKDMNQKLKQMYDYDEWCRKRQTSQIRFG